MNSIHIHSQRTDVHHEFNIFHFTDNSNSFSCASTAHRMRHKCKCVRMTIKRKAKKIIEFSFDAKNVEGEVNAMLNKPSTIHSHVLSPWTANRNHIFPNRMRLILGWRFGHRSFASVVPFEFGSNLNSKERTTRKEPRLRKHKRRVTKRPVYRLARSSSLPAQYLDLWACHFGSYHSSSNVECAHCKHANKSTDFGRY